MLDLDKRTLSIQWEITGCEINLPTIRAFRGVRNVWAIRHSGGHLFE